MVKLGQGTKEVLGGPHLIPDNDPAFPCALDFKELDHRSKPLFHTPHDLLINLERVLRRLFQEQLVRHGTNVRLLT
jgi:hypothetical protein